MNQVMSSLAPSQRMPMRRSQRRKNKLLNKDEPEYSIPNPFKATMSQQCIPDVLSRQLSKFQYLSTRSLKNLSFPEAETHREMDEILLKMRLAAKKQQEEFQEILAKRKENEDYEMEDENENGNQMQNSQEPLPKHSQDSIEIEYSRDMIQQSEGVSIFGDNYEAGRLVFYSDHSIGHGCLKDDFDLI